MVKAMREIPGLVPLTLTEVLTTVSPLTTLPSLGEVKHRVTEYAPDGGVLVAQALVGPDVGVGDGIAVEVGVEVALSVEVAVGVGWGVFVG
jgi:hypothetical protein